MSRGLGDVYKRQSEKGALAKYSDFITSTGGELLVVGICAVGLGALYLTKGKKGGKRKKNSTVAKDSSRTEGL